MDDNQNTTTDCKKRTVEKEGERAGTFLHNSRVRTKSIETDWSACGEQTGALEEGAGGAMGSHGGRIKGVTRQRQDAVTQRELLSHDCVTELVSAPARARRRGRSPGVSTSSALINPAGRGPRVTGMQSSAAQGWDWRGRARNQICPRHFTSPLSLSPPFRHSNQRSRLALNGPTRRAAVVRGAGGGQESPSVVTEMNYSSA
ncbi:hypothetical protein AAFF_G00150880 [Aldrovandia affinis]|uniref:Uncharacterized protein n=1 Tax=Aldrovandia affinis TaxID=143900 RepID=A0AAD7RPK6_9TELE|nr:hypothetical protein AAFF_G00150880 [Aldrovandia affinis]